MTASSNSEAVNVLALFNSKQKTNNFSLNGRMPMGKCCNEIITKLSSEVQPCAARNTNTQDKKMNQRYRDSADCQL